MSTLSTHVLDSSLGTPAAGVATTLARGDGADLASAVTDDDGRVRFDVTLEDGTYSLTFATGAYFADRPHFHPEVTVAFAVEPDREHCHVALLLGPFSYTTYRGS